MTDKNRYITFFTELASYMNLSGYFKNTGSGSIQGIGTEALKLYPELMGGFDNIKGILRFEWVSDPIDTGGKFKEYDRAIPYSFTSGQGDGSAGGIHRLYLPLTQMSIPMTPINGEMKTFRRGSDGEKVNLVTYRADPPVIITMALTLRNTPFSPWVKSFIHILHAVEGRKVTLVIPRYGYDSNNIEKRIQGRVLRLVFNDVTASMQNAVIVFVPDESDDFSSNFW